MSALPEDLAELLNRDPKTVTLNELKPVFDWFETHAPLIPVGKEGTMKDEKEMGAEGAEAEGAEGAEGTPPAAGGEAAQMIADTVGIKLEEVPQLLEIVSQAVGDTVDEAALVAMLEENPEIAKEFKSYFDAQTGGSPGAGGMTFG